jgi:hypothetical protein
MDPFQLPTAPTTGPGSRAGPVISLGGGALLIVGAVTPWASVATAFGTLSIAGTEGDGTITLIVGLVVTLLAVLELANSTDTRALCGIGGVGAGAIGVYDLANISSRMSGLESQFAHPSIGIGLYLTVAGGAAALVGALLKR